jgi:hypothetical protein
MRALDADVPSKLSKSPDNALKANKVRTGSTGMRFDLLEKRIDEHHAATR